MPAPKAPSTDAPYVVRLRDGTERRFSCYDFTELETDGKMRFIGPDLRLFSLSTAEVAEIDFRGGLCTI